MKKKHLIALAIVFIVIISGIATNSDLVKDIEQPTQETEIEATPTPETEISPTPEIEIRKQKYTTLSGIDKNPESGAYGELVVPKINVWENSGPSRGKVVGTISHNTEVEILDEKNTDQRYFQVKTPDDLIGWVSELFTTKIIEK